MWATSSAFDFNRCKALRELVEPTVVPADSFLKKRRGLIETHRVSPRPMSLNGENVAITLSNLNRMSSASQFSGSSFL
jgi:hypothetical protein